MVTAIKNRDEFDAIIKNNELVLVKFTASWCGPCKAIAPVLEQVYNRFTNVEIIEVDVDHHKQISSIYSVSSMPTFVFLEKGKEVDRFSGADPQTLVNKMQEFAAKNPNATRGQSSSTSTENDSIAEYVPSGHRVLNDMIHPPDSEVLNVQSGGAKEVLNQQAIQSDADSQLLLYLPLQNKSKIHTLLLKAEKNEDTQLPNKIKVWANTPGIISFEDATGGLKALQESDVTFDANGYASIELRYVLFQNVGSLVIFLDGEDEDESTVLNELYVIGQGGESSGGKLEKVGED